MVEVSSNVMIDFIVVTITIMLRRSLAESAGQFWQPTELENMANLDFENLKHLQNHGHLLLSASSIYQWKVQTNSSTYYHGSCGVSVVNYVFMV